MYGWKWNACVYQFLHFDIVFSTIKNMQEFCTSFSTVDEVLGVIAYKSGILNPLVIWDWQMVCNSGACQHALLLSCNAVCIDFIVRISIKFVVMKLKWLYIFQFISEQFHNLCEGHLCVLEIGRFQGWICEEKFKSAVFCMVIIKLQNFGNIDY